MIITPSALADVDWIDTVVASDTGAIAEVDVAPGGFPISRHHLTGFVTAVKNAGANLHLILWSVSNQDLGITRRSPSNHYQWGIDVSSPEVVNLDYDGDNWWESVTAVIGTDGWIRLMSYETTSSGTFHMQDMIFLGRGVDVEIALGGEPGTPPNRAETIWALVQYNDTDCDMFLIEADSFGTLTVVDHETGVLDWAMGETITDIALATTVDSGTGEGWHCRDWDCDETFTVGTATGVTETGSLVYNSCTEYGGHFYLCDGYDNEGSPDLHPSGLKTTFIEIAEMQYPYLSMATPEVPDSSFDRAMYRLFDLWNDEMTSCEYSFTPLLDTSLEIQTTFTPPHPTVDAIDADGDGIQHWVYVVPSINLHITDGYVHVNWLWQDPPHVCDIEYELYNQTIVPTSYSWGGSADAWVNPSAASWDFDGTLGEEMILGYKEWSGHGGDLRVTSFRVTETTEALGPGGSPEASQGAWELQESSAPTVALAPSGGEATCQGRECGVGSDLMTWCGSCPFGYSCNASGGCEEIDGN